MSITKAEFERAVHRGLGRAVLWLQRSEIVPDRDFLLYACTHDLAYDRQTEDSRALYMFDVIRATSEPEWYVQAMQRTLAEWDENQEEAGNKENDIGLPVSISQMSDLLALAAQNGDLAAKQSLYAFFEKYAASAFTLYSADALVAMDGLEGCLFAVRQWIINPPQEDDQWYEGYLLREVDEQFGSEAVDTLLEQASHVEPAIGAYLTKFREERAPRHERRKRRPKPDKPDYAELRELIFNTSIRYCPMVWARYGERLPAADAQQLAFELLAETDPLPLARYLLLFRRRPFPLDHAPLLTLAQSEKQEVAAAARAALTQIEHPSVRALALELLDDSLRPWELIEMLTRNFCPGDEKAVERVLSKAWDADEMHQITLRMRRLAEANPQPALAGALLRLYEEGWCTMCRHGVLELLTQFGPLPPSITEECRFDAYDETREFAAAVTSTP